MKCDHLRGLSETAIDALYYRPSPKAQPVLYPDWKKRWQGGNQVYITCPHPALRTSPTEQDYKYKDSRIFIIAWELWFPDLLERMYSRDRPPCPMCGEATSVQPNGWTKYPRRILKLGGYDFLVSRQYRCNNCKGDWIMQRGREGGGLR